MVTSGQVAIWTLVLCGFFTPIMFPNIFTLGIAAWGRDSKGSGLIMTAVVGGAVIPFLIGALADLLHKLGDPATIQRVVLPLLCYLFIAYYGLWGSKLRDCNG